MSPSRSTWARRGVVLTLVVVALGVTAWVAQAEGRSEALWGSERQRVGRDDYDAERSDALYARVVETRARLKLVGTALGLLLVALGATWRDPPRAGSGEPPAWATRGRTLAATLVDGALVGGAWAGLDQGVRVLDLAGHEALVAFVVRLVPLGVLALYVALVRAGGTPGLRLVRARLAPAPGAWRGVVLGVALVPAAALAAVLTLLVVIGAPLGAWLFALHARVAGLVVASR